jgi:uncharacterized protein YodC (DUF2158 family)
MADSVPIRKGIVMPKVSNDVFEIGATVALKSGGPGLTVLGQAGDHVHCVFFSDELGEFKETMLPVVALMPAEMGDDEDHEDADDEDSEGEESEDEGSEEEEDGKKAA